MVHVFEVKASAASTAAPVAAWGVLIDVRGWPEWYPGYVAAKADGPLKLGQTGVVTLVDGRRSPFEVFEWEEGRYMSLGGRAPGTDIRFTYLLETDGLGRTTMTIGHTLTGSTSFLFGRLFGRRVAGYLPLAVERWARLSEQPRR